MKFLFNNKEMYINEYLAIQLETLIYNIKKDWDFFIIITGNRMVRTGKSVLAMVICAYLAMRLKTQYNADHVFFDSKEMIKTARGFPQYSIVHFDEARESLNTTAEREMQRDLINYFAECGQLNHIFVIVLPDFFELKENIAVARSEILLNVYRRSVKLIKKINDREMPIVRYDRGQCQFFNRTRKQKLYDIARVTRRKSYNIVKANYLIDFTNTYPIDEEEYREKKKEYLMRYEDKKINIGQHNKIMQLRNKLVLDVLKQCDNQKEASEYLKAKYNYSISTRSIQTIVADAKKARNSA